MPSPNRKQLLRELIQDLGQLPVVGLAWLDNVPKAEGCTLFGGYSLTLEQLQAIAVITKKAERYRGLVRYLKDTDAACTHEPDFV